MTDLSGVSDADLVKMIQNHPALAPVQPSAPPQLRTAEDAPGPLAVTVHPAAPSSVTPTTKAQAPPDGGSFWKMPLGIQKGVLQPILNAGVAMDAPFKWMGLPTPNKMLGGADASTVRDEYAKYVAAREAQGDKASPVDEALGSMVTTAPLAAVEGPYAAGALGGALSSDAKDAKGVAADAATGALVGKAGNLAGRAIGSVVSPMFRPSVNKMLAEGVKLTPGQIMGGTAHKVEDVATSILGVGDIIGGAQKRAVESFNTAAANRALAPIGETLPANIKPGHDAVAYLQDRLGKEYDRITPQMNVKPDAQLQTDLRGIMTHGSNNLPPEQAALLSKAVNEEILKPMTSGARGLQPISGTVGTRKILGPMGQRGTAAFSVPAPAPVGGSGDVVKTIDQFLNSTRKRYGVSTDPHDQLYAHYLDALQDAVHGAAARQNPALAKQLQATDQAYAQLTRMEPASATAKDGVFTPEQLATSTRKMDPTIRKRGSAAGDAKMQDLAEAGRDTITRTIGESGTASRAAINVAAAAALHGAAPTLSINPLAAAGVAGLTSLYTKRGGAIARAAMTARPSVAPAIRQGIQAANPTISRAAAIMAVKNRDANLRGSQ